MKGIVLVGAIVALVGVLGLAIPVFTTTQTKDVAKVGSLKIQSNEETSHVVPPMAAGAAVVIGLVLVGVGYMKD